MHRILFALLLLIVAASCAPTPAPPTPSQRDAIKQRLVEGTAHTQCAGDCFDRFVAGEESMGILSAKEDWIGLAKAVFDAGHDNELASFYLGKAAEGLGYPNAAISYYRQSLALAQSGRSDQRCAVKLPCPFPAGDRAAKHLAGLNPPIAGRTMPAATPRPATSVAGKARRGIRLDELRNITFFDSEFASQQITLKNGKWRAEDTPLGNSDNPSLASLVWLQEGTAVGDLNGDGVADGAFIVRAHVIIASGQELLLFVVTVGPDGRRKQTKPYYLGDNTTELQSVSIKHGGVLVKLRVQRKGQERWERPKGRAMLNFVLSNGELRPAQKGKHRGIGDKR